MTQRKAEAVAQESTNPLDKRIEKLKQLFPEAVNEDGIDYEALVNLLGKEESRRKRYRFTWAGKQNAILSLHRKSKATLKPAPEESVNWHNTRHLFIEGDNLEVMKLLYRSYFGRVKMIYIDPPYNTGNDFVYPDNFADSLNNYLRLTGQIDDDGNLHTTDVDKAGRRHSNWLSMMYPRLFMARQLLRDDGVIFISIDDNEVHNLRKLMDEIFGEENFLACIAWEKRYTRSNNAKLFYSLKDSIVAYRHSAEVEILREARTQKSDDIYRNPDNDPRGVWTTSSYVNPAIKEKRPNLVYAIENPNTGEIITHPTHAWKYEYAEHKIHVREKRLWWGKDGNAKYPRKKIYLEENDRGLVPIDLWKYEEVGTTDEGGNQLKELFCGQEVFENPKPRRLIQRMISMVTDSNQDDIILDFFAGSATTAHAVLQQNREDGGNRKFIMVQLPEPMDHPQFANIAEVGKERIRRVIKQMQSESAGALAGFQAHSDEDLGFRVFKLDESPLRQWPDLPADSTTAEEYLKQMELMIVDPLLEGWTLPDVITEVALKEFGFSLTWRVEQFESDARQTIYKVIDDEQDQYFYICLDKKIVYDAIKYLDFKKDDRFVFRDSAIDDTIIANLALTCRIKSI